MVQVGSDGIAGLCRAHASGAPPPRRVRGRVGAARPQDHLVHACDDGYGRPAAHADRPPLVGGRHRLGHDPARFAQGRPCDGDAGGLAALLGPGPAGRDGRVRRPDGALPWRARAGVGRPSPPSPPRTASTPARYSRAGPPIRRSDCCGRRRAGSNWPARRIPPPGRSGGAQGALVEKAGVEVGLDRSGGGAVKLDHGWRARYLAARASPSCSSPRGVLAWRRFRSRLASLARAPLDQCTARELPRKRFAKTSPDGPSGGPSATAHRVRRVAVAIPRTVGYSTCQF